MRVTLRRGKLGGWRWFVVDDVLRTRAQSTKFWGWSTREAAIGDAVEVLGSGIHIVAGDTLLYAGERDFSD